MKLETLSLAQNTPEWLAFRQTGIGGSDAACILGLSRFRSNTDLWLEKTGQKLPDDIADKPYVKYGTDAENLLFRLFALDHPQYTAIDSKDRIYKRGFMFASLDGELIDNTTSEHGIFECKTNSAHSKADLDKWENRIPDDYYAQVLHYLIVTGYKFVILKAQIKLEYADPLEIITKHYRFDREDLLADMKILYTAETRFWQSVEQKKRPARILPGI